MVLVILKDFEWSGYMGYRFLKWWLIIGKDLNKIEFSFFLIYVVDVFILKVMYI